MIDPYEIALFGFGLLFSAFFSGAEAVLMSIPVERTKQLIEAGGVKGRIFQFMLEKPTELLTTILVGNNIVNIFVASLATAITSRYFKDDVIAISVGVTTAFILIFGEILPKTIARTKAEALVYPTMVILRFLFIFLYLIVKPLSLIIQLLLGKNAHLNGRLVTKDDIEFMVNQAEKEKTIDSKQIDLLNSILEFPTIKVKDIMVPRNKVIGIDSKNSKFSEILATIREYAHSRYPVFEEDLDNMIGFLHVKDLAFVSFDERENFKVSEFIKEPFYVYEHMKIQAVFDHMNRNKVHLSIVKDENGMVVGIITLEDIMEEIFGEIQDEHDTEEDGVTKIDQPINQDGVIVDGSISLRDLYNEYDVKIPLNDNYSTLTGFILDNLENVFPKKGQMILWEGYAFELTKVNHADILEVTIKSTQQNKSISYSREDVLNGNGSGQGDSVREISSDGGNYSTS
ncbi:MAG: HlyC/CorC family transporter [Halobacteriovoraceae bacterium]|nr:HlyC/CorC family transporter [Halobacteriovoraceae bacterium]